MTLLKNAFVSWSGGKDSCYAMMKAHTKSVRTVVLLNMMNENGLVSRSHAIPRAILEKQAAMLGIPIVTKPASWDAYESIFIETLAHLKSQYHLEAGVFGDIDLQAHRDWEEKVCKANGLEALLPLWQQSRKTLVLEMIAAGIEAYIVSCNDVMGQKYLGEKITAEMVDQLEKIGVDACGENGEYHTLVVNTPLFKHKVNVAFGAKSHFRDYWFIEMNLCE